MTTEHLALVVEDHKRISDRLVEILVAAKCKSVVAANKTDAIAALDTHQFCIVLLDLKIKASRGSNLSDTVHGVSVLDEVRTRHQDHVGPCFWLPVLIVSGFAGEWALGTHVLKNGAHEIIVKPFKAHEVVAQVTAAFAKCGRLSHDSCSRPPPPRAAAATGEILIEIPGEIVGRRAVVLVASHRFVLEPRFLELLLRLLVGYAKKEMRHKSELGAPAKGGFRLPSELGKFFGTTLGDVELITNDGRGSYGLSTKLKIARCNTEALEAISERSITKTARELREILDEKRA